MRSLLCCLVLAGCGGGGGDPVVDAPVTEIDAAVDAPASHCTYTEQHDDTNDDVDGGGTAEDTGVALSARTIVCGSFASTHFDGDITVDVDSFKLTTATARDILLRLHGTGAGAIELVGVDLYTGPTLSTLVGSATFYGDHGVAALHLVPGTYALTAFALNSAAITAPVSYELEIVDDTPLARCPDVTTGGYAEATDGGASTGNDVVAIPSGSPIALSTATTDAPEPTGITLVAGNTRITGSAADVAVADQYEDKDTFAFTTGTSTNEIAVRLTWPGTTANLDAFLFEATSVDPVFRAVDPATTGPELRTYSVIPNKSYWLTIGAKTGGTGFPIAYAATLCGAVYTPGP